MTKQLKIRICVTLLGAFLAVLSAALVLRHLGAIVEILAGSGGDIDFAHIFGQTSDASITPHLLLPLIYFWCFAVFYTKHHPHGAVKIIGCILAGSLCFLVACVCALLLTRVNGIRFIHLLRALIPMLGAL